MSQITKEEAGALLRKALGNKAKVEASFDSRSGTRCHVSGLIRSLTPELEVTVYSDSPTPSQASTLSFRLAEFECEYDEIREDDAVIFSGFPYGTSMLMFRTPDRKESVTLYFKV